jgi:NlpC/P60 family putative phage cell wall peptidase
MVTRADIVAEASEWLRTPFHWQQSVKGAGCDCKGLVAGIARELGMPEAQSIYASMMADHSGRVDERLLIRGLAETMIRTTDPQPGDVLLLRMGGKPQHLAIHAGERLIHCYASAKPPACVISTPIEVALRAWPLHSAWTWGSINGH